MLNLPYLPTRKNDHDGYSLPNIPGVKVYSVRSTISATSPVWCPFVVDDMIFAVPSSLAAYEMSALLLTTSTRCWEEDDGD